MIAMRLGQRDDGVDTAEAEWGGREFRAESRSGATNALARLLVSAGAEDQPWQAVRGAVVCLTGVSLHGHAARVVSEGDSGIKSGWWAPYPHVMPDQTLERAIAAVREAARTAGRGASGRVVAGRAFKPLAGER